MRRLGAATQGRLAQACASGEGRKDMFARRTVFVVGAGCSFEYGLPVGETLKSQIVDRMGSLSRAQRARDMEPYDELMLSAVRKLAHQEQIDAGNKVGLWLEAAGKIARGLPHSTSIDRYLAFRSDDPRIVQLGKLAIVQTILEAERASSLQPTPLDHAAIAGVTRDQPHWLGQLFGRMQEGVAGKARIADLFRNVTFVCFNYDRCIEHYFFNALVEYGDFNEEEAARVMAGMRIIHPYGRIGALPWDLDVSQSLRADYGVELSSHEQLLTLAKGIRTFTEGAHDAQHLPIHEALLEAEQVVFLGFSFLDQNMDMLTPNVRCPPASVTGTVFNESSSNQDLARALVHSMLSGRTGGAPEGHRIEFHGMTAGQFLANNGNALMR